MPTQSDTKLRILSTARTLFHNRSYTDVGVKEICDLAKVPKGSFYHFFCSKQALIIEVIDDLAKSWTQDLITKSFSSKYLPMERFEKLIDAVFYWQKTAKEKEGSMPGCLFGKLALELSTKDQEVRSRVAIVFNELQSRFIETLDEAIAAGDIPPLNKEATAEAMLAYLEGVMLLAKSRNDPMIFLELGPAVKNLRIDLKNAC